MYMYTPTSTSTYTYTHPHTYTELICIHAYLSYSCTYPCINTLTHAYIHRYIHVCTIGGGQNLWVWIMPESRFRSIPPDPYPEHINRLKMSWRKRVVFLALTDHLPCRAGFSYATGEHMHIYVYIYICLTIPYFDEPPMHIYIYPTFIDSSPSGVFRRSLVSARSRSRRAGLRGNLDLQLGSWGGFLQTDSCKEYSIV